MQAGQIPFVPVVVELENNSSASLVEDLKHSAK
jgi:hypothetical protein